MTDVPIKTPPNRFQDTQTLVREIEADLDGKLVCYWVSPNGSVCQNDVNVFNEILNRVGRSDRLYLFVKSDGGDGKASLRMVNLLREHCKTLIALVPLECESAATMLVLGADRILMGPMAYLTPVDTWVRHDLSPIDKDNDRVRIGVNEIERIVSGWKRVASARDENVYKVLFQHIHPLAIAAVDRAGSLSNMLCDQIMSYHIRDAKRRRRISRILNADYPSHGYPIVLREAQRIGIKAVPLPAPLNEKLIRLNEIYSEMGQKCRTDFDPHHHRDNEIINIVECAGTMIYFHLDKEWHYRENERIWRSTNDYSCYKVRSAQPDGEPSESLFHVR